jgi:galactose oxidase-like protein/Big-like domain-containing protein/Kelch motif protein
MGSITMLDALCRQPATKFEAAGWEPNGSNEKEMTMKTISRIHKFPVCMGLMIGLLMSTGCGGGSSSSSSTSTPRTLTSISLAPQNATLSTAVTSGVTQQFTATGVFSDQSTKDLTTSVNWTSSSTAVASMGVTTGLATAASAGTSTIKATDPSSGLSGSTMLTVTDVVSFTATGPMKAYQTGGYTATLLMSGEVLVSGGHNGGCLSLGCSDDWDLAELFDPKASGFTLLSGTMTGPRQSHGAILLLSGKVLIVGGQACSGYNPQHCTPLFSAELFDPTSETFTATGSMAMARISPTVSLLSDGSVLVTGGGFSSAELFDPMSGNFTTTGSMNAARTLATATGLQNGQVLIAGGFDSAGNSLASAELYDPATKSFSPTTGSLVTARAQHTASLLSDGRVLIAGGVATGVGSNAGVLASAELFDPATGQFSAAGNMTTARVKHTATVLNNGRVLLTGGVGPDAITALASTEVFDPATQQFTAAGAMNTPRAGHTATLLNNGKGLVAQGATAELFQ